MKQGANQKIKVHERGVNVIRTRLLVIIVKVSWFQSLSSSSSSSSFVWPK